MNTTNESSSKAGGVHDPPKPRRKPAQEHCSEIKKFSFKLGATNTGGFIRTVPVAIDEPLKKYFLVWETEGPIIITAELRDKFHRLWQKQTLKMETGAAIGSACWASKADQVIRLEIGISPQGASGKISLFAFTSPNQRARS